VEVCEFVLRTAALPGEGGDTAHITVTMPYEPLARSVGAATLDTGERLGATAVRRLACDAAIIPAVLGGAGQVLELGRSRRLIAGSLRRALVLRDGGCAFPTCDRPPRWCQGHHIRWHHRFVHQGSWTVRPGPDGRPDFHPPAWIDPHRMPRRNSYHHRRL
jgi:hypothetical protein